MLCRDVLFTNDPLSSTLHHVAPNFLQELGKVGRESKMTPIQEGRMTPIQKGRMMRTLT
jgi:hypothetical protein